MQHHKHNRVLSILILVLSVYSAAASNETLFVIDYADLANVSTFHSDCSLSFSLELLGTDTLYPIVLSNANNIDTLLLLWLHSRIFSLIDSSFVYNIEDYTDDLYDEYFLQLTSITALTTYTTALSIDICVTNPDIQYILSTELANDGDEIAAFVRYKLIDHIHAYHSDITTHSLDVNLFLTPTQLASQTTLHPATTPPISSSQRFFTDNILYITLIGLAFVILSMMMTIFCVACIKHKTDRKLKQAIHDIESRKASHSSDLSHSQPRTLRNSTINSDVMTLEPMPNSQHAHTTNPNTIPSRLARIDTGLYRNNVLSDADDQSSDSSLNIARNRLANTTSNKPVPRRKPAHNLLLLDNDSGSEIEAFPPQNSPIHLQTSTPNIDDILSYSDTSLIASVFEDDDAKAQQCSRSMSAKHANKHQHLYQPRAQQNKQLSRSADKHHYSGLLMSDPFDDNIIQKPHFPMSAPRSQPPLHAAHSSQSKQMRKFREKQVNAKKTGRVPKQYAKRAVRHGKQQRSMSRPSLQKPKFAAYSHSQHLPPMGSAEARHSAPNLVGRRRRVNRVYSVQLASLESGMEGQQQQQQQLQQQIQQQLQQQIQQQQQKIQEQEQKRDGRCVSGEVKSLHAAVRMHMQQQRRKHEKVGQESLDVDAIEFDKQGRMNVNHAPLAPAPCMDACSPRGPAVGVAKGHWEESRSEKSVSSVEYAVDTTLGTPDVEGAVCRAGALFKNRSDAHSGHGMASVPSHGDSVVLHESVSSADAKSGDGVPFGSDRLNVYKVLEVEKDRVTLTQQIPKDGKGCEVDIPPPPPPLVAAGLVPMPPVVDMDGFEDKEDDDMRSGKGKGFDMAGKDRMLVRRESSVKTVLIQMGRYGKAGVGVDGDMYDESADDDEGEDTANFSTMAVRSNPSIYSQPNY